MAAFRFTVYLFAILLCPFAVSQIVPSPEHTLNFTGTVTDAETREAIPKFNVYFGHFGQAYQNVSSDSVYWETKPDAGSNGTYKFSGSDARASVFAVKVTEEGYETALSRHISPDEGDVSLNFALKKLPPGTSARIHGIVLQPDGTPAANADIAMNTFYNNELLKITNGRTVETEKPFVVSTDAEGRFQFEYIDFEEAPRFYNHSIGGQKKINYILYCLHDSGFSRLTEVDWQSLDTSKTITLQPWGRIEGVVKIGSQLDANRKVWCQVWYIPSDQIYPFRSAPPWQPDNPNPLHIDPVIADESGKFSFDRVYPSGYVRVWRSIINEDTRAASLLTFERFQM